MPCTDNFLIFFELILTLTICNKEINYCNLPNGFVLMFYNIRFSY